MARSARAKTVKSASRILEILELFGERRSSVTVMDVSRALDYPQSSTSELLSCLVSHGYLMRNRVERSFRPTARVPLLGAWVEPNLFRSGKLLTMMDELHSETGHVVVLGAVIEAQLSHAHVVGPVPDVLACHSTHHLLRSPIGKTLLSTSNREHVRKLAHRLNAECAIENIVRFETLWAELETIRAQGYASGLIMDGWAGLSVLLPRAVGQEAMALAIIGPPAEVEPHHGALVKAIRGAVAHHVGPIDIDAPTPVVAERHHASAY